MSRITEDIKEIAKFLANDIIIAFIGPTGSGMSNFIDTLTGQLDHRASSHLESCTTELRAIRLFDNAIYGNRLVLVDTPGFDDANKTDMEILEMVNKWLQKVYQKRIKLSGIVYVRRITDNRSIVTGSPHRNLRMFNELCGDQAMKKLVLVTTMWDIVKKRPQEKYNRREKDLFENYWKKMMELGASTARFTNCLDSAWKIIDDIVRKRDEAKILLLQEEIVDLRRALNETEAGKDLYSDMQKLLAEQRDTVRSLSQQAREENNPRLARQLEAKLKRIRKRFEKKFDEMKNPKKLKIPICKRIMLFFSEKS